MLRVGRAGGRLSAVALAGLLAVVAPLGGCGEQKPKEETVRDVVEAQQRARRVKARADLQAIQTALQAHYAEQGRFPDRLEALPLVQDQRIDTSVYAYDPGTGQVSLREP
ncbi:MAG TPA: hypothetical protein VIG69_01500 [Candidatus Methylomirabilis sp.]|jgi:hypothetical protein